MSILTDSLTVYTVGITALIGGIIYCWHKSKHEQEMPIKPKPRKRKTKAFVMPPWAIKRAQELEPPKMTAQQLQSLHERKPPKMWDTVLFFPDMFPSRPDSSIQQLKSYFQNARTSIYLCMYLCSNYALSNVVRDKFDEGLLVRCVSEYDTWTAHNNKGIKDLAKRGVPVRLNRNGFMMHNKFAIIDEEALITGSLNWTRQGVENNNENVLVTIDPRIVSKYLKEFNRLFGVCKTWQEEVNNTL